MSTHPKTAGTRVTKLCHVCQKPHTNQRYCSVKCREAVYVLTKRIHTGRALHMGKTK